MSSRRLIRLLVGGVLALLGAATCLVVVGPVAQAASGPLKPLKVVILGDSYSAGNGARKDDGGRNYYGPSDCYRSHSNWGERYVASLEAAGYAVTPVNRACSGGVTKDIDNPRKMDTQTYVFPPTPLLSNSRRIALLNAAGLCRDADDEYYHVTVDAGVTSTRFQCERYLHAQLDAIGSDTDLVLMTDGGNDIKFSDIVKQCFVIGLRDPSDCRQKVGFAEGLLNDPTPTGVAPSLTRVLSKVRAKMRPDARIALVSYPYLEQRDDYRLRSDTLTYPAGSEVRRIGRLGDDKQRAVVDALDATPGPNITYVDGVKARFAGHEPEARDGNPARWLNEAFDTRIFLEWYHDNGEGHVQLADLLSSYGTFGAVSSPRGEGSVDIVFAIDTTGSMGSTIQTVRDVSNQLIAQIAETTTSYRVAVVSYRDQPAYTGNPSDYPSRVDLDFTTDRSALSSALDNLQASGGGDTPESVYSGLDTALSQPWRPAVKKVVIALGDAPPHDPEPVSGLTADAIVAKAFNVDPAEIYGVDVGSLGLDSVASRTGGAVYTGRSSAEIASALSTTLDTALAKPYAWAGGPYLATTGQPVTLDASGSFAPGTSIVSYGWDFDGDGAIDETTTDPKIQHTYSSDFDGLVAVTVTDANGRSSVGNATMQSSVDGDGIPTVADNCPKDDNPGQEDEDGDGIGDVCDSTPGFPTTERPGVEAFLGPDSTSTPTTPISPTPTTSPTTTSAPTTTPGPCPTTSATRTAVAADYDAAVASARARPDLATSSAFDATTATAIRAKIEKLDADGDGVADQPADADALTSAKADLDAVAAVIEARRRLDAAGSATSCPPPTTTTPTPTTPTTAPGSTTTSAAPTTTSTATSSNPRPAITITALPSTTATTAASVSSAASDNGDTTTASANGNESTSSAPTTTAPATSGGPEFSQIEDVPAGAVDTGGGPAPAMVPVFVTVIGVERRRPR